MQTFSLSVLMAIFPGVPGLAGFIDAKEMEVVVTTGAIRRAKLQSNVTTNKPTPADYSVEIITVFVMVIWFSVS